MSPSTRVVDEIKRLANEHFASPEVRYFLTAPLSMEAAARWVKNQVHFIKNRRDCWALAASVAPLDVKRAIWHHEQDELIHDPRAGMDHFRLMAKEAAVFGVTEEELRRSPAHPLVQAALEAWLLMGRGSWLEAFTAVSMVEIVNSNAIIQGGGFSSRMRQRLAGELGIGRERLVDQNVHVEADMQHALIFETVAPEHIRSEVDESTVLAAARHALVIDRAFRAACGFAMREPA